MMWIVLLILLVAASGFFSLSQIALFSLPSSAVRGQVAQLLKRPRSLLVTLLMCDIGTNIWVQSTSAELFGKYAGWGLKVGVPLALTLLLGEIFPKTLALSHNRGIAYRVAPVVAFLQWLLTPIRVALEFVASYISRAAFFFLGKEKEISPEELVHVLKKSEKHGILSRDEVELVKGYLALADTTVKERMHPRHEILFYDIETPLPKLVHLFTEKRCAKVPVCKGDLQNMLGLLSADAFFQHQHTIEEGRDTLSYLVKPHYVPETIGARTLLRHFLRAEEKMAIVVDEYGSIAGLVTQEDLFEVVIGEIADTRDEKERYTPAGKDVLVTSGKFELSEFEHLFGVKLPTENNMVTIGGWLTERLGDIPKSGTQYVWNQFLFQVLAADPNRVRRVYIRKVRGK